MPAWRRGESSCGAPGDLQGLFPSVSPQTVGQDVGIKAGPGESSVGEWLKAIGMERYEEGLIHNGWDDLEFLR